MKIKQFNPALPALLAMAVFVAACSSAPTTTSLLDQTRGDFMAAQGNPAVTSYAPVEFKQASEALEQANAAAARKDSQEKVDKLAYLAKQKIATAQEVAKQKSAEAEVGTAGKQRDQVRLEARTQEADQAKLKAEEAQRQAAAAQAQAQNADAATRDAQARAAALEAQLADLSAKKTERGMIITLGDVLFGTDQARLTPDGMQTARKLADVLANNPKRTVLIEGFTDSTGGADHNLALSQRRAEAVRNALQEMGVARDRIATRGYGEAYPVAGNDSASNRQLNRRVEIVLSEEGSAIPARR
ncbi:MULTISPECIES: OmpA family protein [unclassified Janthinobacterium]|uniref:OmpA family protein n=1 Tax=unclassified Janthinobacterium TaxID=2610881 RepID=UPI000346B1E1|nr:MULTISPECIES: OmpA family protein [unclassified Janthinobacterium]MEC5163803.1 outer membrane protein OmpA-like peptidoglycan-associated protein [Janthinobacterium sp. CG_S6]